MNRRRTWLWHAPAVAMTVLSAAGCRSGSSGPFELVTAQERWQRNGPATYTMTLLRSCECLAESAGPVRVSVSNGTVESRVYVQTGAAVASEYTAIFPAVEGLFAIIDNAIRNGTRPLTVRYHGTLGYPTRIELGDPAVDSPVYLVTELQAR